MSAIYRNNRLVPVVIITTCLWMTFFLLHTSNINPQAVEGSFTVVQVVSKESPILAQDAPASTSTLALEHEREISSSAVSPPEGALLPEDVLLIVKTGGTTMFKRLLIHLTTTFAPERIPLQNTVIYSDSPDTIGAFRVVDVLANTTSPTLNTTEFNVYRSQAEYNINNVYLEAAGLDGDDWGPQGGWIIDKYKFVPLVQHAGKNWPGVKWYIYTEDDTFLFLPNVLKYLNQFDHAEAHWLGSYAAKSDVVFAQGGAGFALSRGAWEKSFGQNPNLAEEYEQYTAEHCCGDQVLGHALNRYGIRLGENGGDEVFRYGFNPLVHWSFTFEKWSWCLPLYSWHKVHARDVARYYEFEKTWHHAKPFTHGDFFMAMIAPELKSKREWWDNMSNKFKVTSANKDSPPMPESVKSEGVSSWKNAWMSADACAAACEEWDGCIQWSFAEDLCKMDDTASWGTGYASEMSQRKTALMTTSGWMTKRLEQWNSHCAVGP
ncbi:hypothetical protein N0V93_007666 [Gnomoniopsis smithogilvyi]|uniref:N-acetylgalactosaminide beta-1,3-galactosyltransferase n=1 Tax=Gnomoniopsis smithogilvyi TaxID=1191159 RepID=A0A9W9CU53_9PEZI|nr:hypothetical protein N0V93_007666 [Gnomoniopsis smithogilvyi]